MKIKYKLHRERFQPWDYRFFATDPMGVIHHTDISREYTEKNGMDKAIDIAVELLRRSIVGRMDTQKRTGYETKSFNPTVESVEQI